MADNDFGTYDFLRRLMETPGIPGREERIRELILAETDGLWEEVRVDNMGNLICLKRATRTTPTAGGGTARRTPRKSPARAKRSARGKQPTPATETMTVPEQAAEEGRAPRVMIACHMDEIGFYVRHIDEQGYLRVQNAGGFDTRNLFARRVLVQGREDLIGVLNPSGKPVHLASPDDRKKVPEINDFYVDLFRDKEEVRNLVEVGDPVTLHQSAARIGDAITGKALDNRVAVWAGIEAIRRAFGGAAPGRNGRRQRAAARRPRTGEVPYDVYFVACVQEEVGLRGATTAAFGVEPDIGVAIDTTLCCDTPGISKDDAVTQFGQGVGIKVMDGASISHHGLFNEFIAVAKQKKISHQREVLPRGGTDAGAVQRARAGARAITLSVPTRYIHTVTEAVHTGDADAAVELLAAWLTS